MACSEYKLSGRRDVPTSSMLRPTYLAHQFNELASAIQAEFEAAQANLEFVANMWPRVPS